MKRTGIKVRMNRRTKTVVLASAIVLLLAIISLAGIVMNPNLYAPDYSAKKLNPSFQHPFGTDYLGRDMFFRSIKGLSASILISFMLGGGLKGVVIGVAFTHWPGLTRVIRGEVMQVRNAQYVKASMKFGASKMQVAWNHIVPHVVPQFIIGLILLFPHAILHEAGLTFLGFGLPIDEPAIGIILAESLKHIATGMWWLVLFPGVMLVFVVMLFDKLGEQIKLLIDPSSAQE